MGPWEGLWVFRGGPYSSERCCMHPSIPMPGRLSAAFLSSAINVLLFGVTVSYRGGVFRPILALLSMPALGGIICVSNLIWCILWIVLYCLLAEVSFA